MNHIINRGNEIAQTDYKLCHGKTTTAIHWHVCKNYNFQISQMWQDHKIKTGVKNGIFKYTLITIQKSRDISTDLITPGKVIFVDITIPAVSRMEERIRERKKDCVRENFNI